MIFVPAAAVAGIVVARKYGAVRQELKRTKMLFEVSMQLNSTIRKNDLVALIMDTAAKVTDSEGSSVILVDPHNGDLYFEVATGAKGDQVKQIRLKFGEGIAGHVAQSGESVIVNDASKDSRWSDKVSTKVGMTTRNLLCVPIINRGETIGVLQVLNKKNGKVYSDHDIQLMKTIAAPTAIALENSQLYEALEYSIDVLKDTTAAKERMESELKIAGDIQLSFLPRSIPSFADDSVDIYAVLKPARDVGGDFFNYFYIDDHRLFFTLGDVSDKGIPAALFMAATMTLIKGKLGPGMEPGELLTLVNQELCKDEPTMFATIFCAILDTRSGVLQYSDGGHCTPYRLQKDGEITALDMRKGIPLGIFEDAEYVSQSAVLVPDDRIVLYSDGITEAENADQKQFRTSRLLDVLQHNNGAANARLVPNLLEQVERFSDGAPQSDDIAVLAVQFLKERAAEQ